MTPTNLLVHLQVDLIHKDLNLVIRTCFADFDKNYFSLLAKSHCGPYYLKPTTRIKTY